MSGAESDASAPLETRISQLSPQRRKVLERLLEQKRQPAASVRSQQHRIPRRSGTGQAPLSSAQQRVWVMDQLTRSSFLYNEHNAFRFPYAIDVDAFRRSVNEIIRRHEILRTTFATENGSPVQVVAPHLTIDVPVVDLRDLSSRARETRSLEIASEEAKMPCDLRTGPLIWAKVLRVADGDYIFLLTMHHIVCDGWSMEVFFRELTILYVAFSAGRASPLPELRTQYADFAVWQQHRLSEGLFDEALSYWRERLGDMPLLALPTDRPRPSQQTFEGARENLEIDRGLYQQLTALCQREGVTTFMFMLAAFQVLLARYCGQDDIVVGAPIANREQPELMELIGFFVNTLVLRTDMSGDPSFREVLKRVRTGSLEAYAHQDLPFERLVDDLAPERDLSRNPLFQVIFQVFNWATGDVDSPQEAKPPLEVHTGGSMFDLRLDLIETPGGFNGSCEYSTALFDRSTIARMVEHFMKMLESIVENPQVRISELELLTDSERQRLVVELNATESPYPRNASIPELFETHVAASGDSVALEFGGRTLNYVELNRCANRLAHFMRRRGVGPDVVVALYMERSEQLIVSILGVLKAGGAYLPVDVLAPEARVRQVLDESRATCVIVHGKELLAVPEGCEIIELDELTDALAAESAENPTRVNEPENLAYVMFTSGSIGKPKGVMVPHRAVVRLVKNTNYVTPCLDDVFLQFSPASFDASTFEIWGALLNGARVLIHPPEQPSIEDLAQFIQDGRATIVFLTSALFHQIVDVGLEKLGGLRYLFTGGDFVSARQIKRAARRLSSCRVAAVYGPTENTTYSSVFPVTGGTELGASVPLGTPIANSTMYVLDQWKNPVAIGVTGEIYVGGDGLARGYLNRDDLTSRSFVPNPIGDAIGERLYRTGDLGKYRPDGNVEMIGRVDRQVKIRGFRVEVDEIEAVLNECPVVSASVVIALENPKQGKALAAYVVPATQDGATAPADDRAASDTLVDDTREFLRQRLPEYMVPAAFVVLDTLPVTANGKFDRAKLPDPNAAARPDATERIGPRTEAERRVASIWADVLGRSDFGMEDNFFDLGGHSLLATQVVSRLRDAFGIEFPLRRLFEKPFVASIAESVVATETPDARATSEGTVDGRPPVDPEFDVAGLSDKDVDALLNEVLGEGEQM